MSWVMGRTYKFNFNIFVWEEKTWHLHTEGPPPSRCEATALPTHPSCYYPEQMINTLSAGWLCVQSFWDALVFVSVCTHSDLPVQDLSGDVVSGHGLATEHEPRRGRGWSVQVSELRWHLLCLCPEYATKSSWTRVNTDRKVTGCSTEAVILIDFT